MCYFLGYDVKKIKHVRIREHQIEYGKLNSMRAVHNGFEYDNLEIIRANGNAQPECSLAHWEFIPYWIKTDEELFASRKKGIPTLNATSEKLLDSKVFRNAALNRRCLLPVSWFFEWKDVTPAGAKKKKKIQYCIEPQNNDYLLLAGIWQPWTNQLTGETIDTFAIVTTKANELMAEIHNTKKRMPLMLSENAAAEWISPLKEDQIKEIISTDQQVDLKATSMESNNPTLLLF